MLYLPTRTGLTLAIISQKNRPKKKQKTEQTNKRKSTADTRVNISDVPTFTGAQTPAEENLAAARFEFLATETTGAPNSSSSSGSLLRQVSVSQLQVEKWR